MGTDENGYITNHEMLLEVAPLKTSENYKLENENPDVYTDSEDEDRFRPRREWPDKLWNKQKMKAIFKREMELRESLIQGHHLAVEMLRKMDVDPCQLYKESHHQNILENLVSQGSTVCTICGLEVSTTENLKKHIKIKHIGKTNYKCRKSDKYFTDTATLKVHMRKHDEEGYSFECDDCNKKFPSIGKLNEHKETHSKEFKCSYCQKVFKHKRNLNDHEKESCKLRPLPLVQPMQEQHIVEIKYKCTLCEKAYKYKRYLNKHVTQEHQI